jgi:hypothetical protein
MPKIETEAYVATITGEGRGEAEKTLNDMVGKLKKAGREVDAHYAKVGEDRYIATIAGPGDLNEVQGAIDGAVREIKKQGLVVNVSLTPVHNDPTSSIVHEGQTVQEVKEQRAEAGFDTKLSGEDEGELARRESHKGRKASAEKK